MPELRARSRRGERLATLLIWSGATLVSALSLWMLGDLLWHGLGQLSWEFLTAPPADAGRAGGLGPIIISTLLVVLVCLMVAVPLGLGTAVLLAEYSTSDSRLGRLVRRSLDVLAGVPSIVFGLFGSAFFCNTLGLGFSILAGGLTLACMVLPILVRTIEVGFGAVPDAYRSGAAALGLSRGTTLFRLLLPAALPGLVVGLVLGIGRALAETAALIFTSGAVDRMPESLLDSGRTLSVHIYELSMNVPGGTPHAYGAALVLLALLLLINGTAAQIASRWLGREVALA